MTVVTSLFFVALAGCLDSNGAFGEAEAISVASSSRASYDMTLSSRSGERAYGTFSMAYEFVGGGIDWNAAFTSNDGHTTTASWRTNQDGNWARAEENRESTSGHTHALINGSIWPQSASAIAELLLTNQAKHLYSWLPLAVLVEAQQGQHDQQVACVSVCAGGGDQQPGEWLSGFYPTTEYGLQASDGLLPVSWNASIGDGYLALTFRATEFWTDGATTLPHIEARATSPHATRLSCSIVPCTSSELPLLMDYPRLIASLQASESFGEAHIQTDSMAVVQIVTAYETQRIEPLNFETDRTFRAFINVAHESEVHRFSGTRTEKEAGVDQNGALEWSYTGTSIMRGEWLREVRREFAPVMDTVLSDAREAFGNEAPLVTIFANHGPYLAAGPLASTIDIRTPIADGYSGKIYDATLGVVIAEVTHVLA